MSITDEDSNQSSWTLIAVILTIVIAIFLFWKFGLSDEPIEDENTDTVVVAQPIEEEFLLPPVQENVIIEEPMSETVLDENDLTSDVIPDLVEEPIEVLPESESEPALQLNESDSWVQETLASIIWRKELLDLIVNDDMIRRFVVFVDNFAQGTISYNNSPFVKPLNEFSVIDELNSNDAWYVDQASFNRFSRYVELLRAVDTDILVEKYIESKPLISEAYAELGYPDSDFTEKLEAAITKVLDVEYPKNQLEVIRPSVMYKYKDVSIESLDDAEKLMVRLGKENLLVIKSVLLEVNEKLQ
jgi:hypothetical protein